MFDNAIANLVGMVNHFHLKEDYNKSVCELGNQTFMNTPMQRNIVGGQAKDTAHWFYMLGFTRYLAIDVNTRMNAEPMDLNFVLKDRYGFDEQFDMVTNNGTGEHIFNQASVFENMHNLTKKGGWMLYVLPFQKHCDHGFYNFQPNLFAALAEQNNYIVDRSIVANAMWTRDVKIPLTVERQTSLCNDINLWNDWDPKWDPEILIAMQKTDDAPFRIPFQGLYRKDIEDPDIQKSYKDIPN